MSTLVWESGTPLPATFGRSHSALLEGCSTANFTMDLGFLRWEHAHGRGSRAVLYGGPDGLGAVFRRTDSGWGCGWPWRPQVAWVAGSEPASEWPEPAALGRSVRACARAAGIQHARVYLPSAAVDERTSYFAGTTVSRRLDVPEDTLLREMDHNKRRNLRQARLEGYEVSEARTAEDFRAFAALQVDTERRRGAHPPGLPAEPATGESWREWELPWMWLLLARREGRIEAGSGFGCFARGVLDYHANASTPRARLAGVNVLLAWEAMRRGRVAGYRRMNWCGSTIFKRGLGGERISMMCFPEGGPLWRVPDAFEVGWHRTRCGLVRRWKQGAKRRPA